MPREISFSGSIATTYDLLTAALMGWGFQRRKLYATGLALFEHNATGLLLSVPDEAHMRAIHIQAMRSQISNFGIASEADFDRIVAVP